MSLSTRGSSGLVSALWAGLQWRLLLIWVLLMLIPTAVASWPMSATLGDLLDHSVHSADWASAFDSWVVGDVFMQVGKSMPAIGAAGVAAALITIMLSPLLTGMVVTSARSSSRPGFVELLQGGLVEYGRMLRVWLLALISWGIAIAILFVLLKLSGDHAEQAIHETDVRLWSRTVLVISVLLLVWAHFVAESARAAFVVDRGLTSATRAFIRGLRLRPRALLGFLVVSVIGYALVLAFGMLRMRNPAVGGLGTVMAFVLAQLVVLSMAWMRIARIHAIAAALPGRRSGGLSGPSRLA